MHNLITNPPFNMRWKPPELAGFMPKYSGYTIPPEQNANYAFILSGLELTENRAVFLLPNGVLSSGVKAEQEIRQQLIQRNFLLAVITLPPNMFESTNIPTCRLIFDKHKETRIQVGILVDSNMFGGKAITASRRFCRISCCRISCSALMPDASTPFGKRKTDLLSDSSKPERIKA